MSKLFSASLRVCSFAFLLCNFASGQTKPVASRNVNIVSGTKWGTGDPFLTKQNEPSVAVSSLNPQHLLAGSNDYRLIDFTNFNEIPGDSSSPDAWVSLYKSTDGGVNWKSVVMSGCPQNIPECNSPLSSAIKGLQFAADPTVRSGPYGTFFYSFIAGNRGTSANSVIAVQRFVDKNNTLNVAGDPFQADVVNILDTGTTGQFKDKPWNAADIPGRPWNAGATCTLPNYAKPVPAFNVYVSYSNFVGQSNSNSHPQVLVARSTDCGQTFQNAVKISNSISTNSGSSIAIDPQNGYVYVTWRYFGTSASDPSAIYVSLSTDGGNKFSNPIQVATFTPFDQATSGASFRTNALPTIAASVKSGISRIHIAWAQRKANGDARIVISTSADGNGKKWSAPVAVDNWIPDSTLNPGNPNGRGHQLQPALMFAGGKLTAVWFDQRNDSTFGVLTCPTGPGTCTKASQWVETRRPVGNLASPGGENIVFTQFLTDATPGLLKRHTLDVFTAMADPDNPCLISGCAAFVSTRVSQYRMGNEKLTSKGSAQIQQLGFNAPNLPIFVKGTASFLGDYMDLGTRMFLPTGNPNAPFKFNTDPADKSAFHAVWTDNRDIVPPPNNNWASYVPVSQIVTTTNGGVTTTSTATNINCVNPGARNQNIYWARITEGTEVSVSANIKKIDTGTPRGFVVTVKNSDSTAHGYSLTINPPPPGVIASFQQDLTKPPISVLTLSVPPSSSVSRTVWASSTSGATPQLTVTVADGAKSYLVALNPDPLSAPIQNVDLTNVDLTNVDLTNISVKTVDLTNVDLTNVDLTNVDLTNVDLTNFAFRNVDLTNVDLTNVDLTNVDLTNVAVTNVDPTNVDLTNVAVTNVDLTNMSLRTVDLTNVDLTNSAYTNVDLTNVDLTNVDLTNGAMSDASFTLVNRSNTDVSVNVKSLLRGNTVPDKYKLQLVLRKVSLHATANSACKIVFTQQSTQDATVAPKPVDPTAANLGAFDVTNGDVSNATMPLAANEQAYVTMRILAPTPDLATEFGQNALKFVAAGPKGSRTPIPLIIQTLALGSVTALTPASLPLKAFGGTGNVTWYGALADGTPLPSWLTIVVPSPSADSGRTVLLNVAAPQAGTYKLRFTAKDDGSIPTQTDNQVLTLVVAPVRQTITFTQPSDHTFGDAPFALLATADSGLPVTLTSNSATICTVSGAQVTLVGAGTCSITASQPGNANYAAATPVTRIFTVNLKAQAITFTQPADHTFGDTPFALLATADSGLTVTLTSNSVTVCTVSGAQVTLVGAGTCSITASQTGNANYSAAAPVTKTFTVNAAAQTLTFAQPADHTFGDAPFALLATADSGLPVLLASNSVSNCTVSGAQVTILTAGSCSITASQAGNANYTAALSVTRIFNIAKAGATLTVSNVSQTYDGTVKTVTVVTAPANLTGVSVAYTGNHQDAGSYPFTASLNNANYTASPVSGNLAIAQSAAVITLSGLNQTYDGNPKQVIVTTVPAGLAVSVTYNGSLTAPSAAGMYAVLATVSSGNYAGSAAGTLVIRQDLISPTGKMAQARSLHTATLLKSGLVLLTGGLDANGSPTATAELFDPASGTFQAVDNMPSKSVGHAAALLNDGRVLVTGGGNSSSEIYDPATRTFAPGGGLSSNRSFHTATTLPNGKVLVAGGAANNSIVATTVIYDPATATFIAGPNMLQSRERHTATLINGKVLFAGGRTKQGNGYVPVASLEIYDPQTNTFAPAGSLTAGRYAHAAVLSGSNLVLAGGSNGTTDLNSSEIYNITTGLVTPGAALLTGRSALAAAPASGNRVLLTGGQSGAVVLASTAILDATFVAGPAMAAARANHTATALGDGRVLISGGNGTNGIALNTAELFSSQP